MENNWKTLTQTKVYENPWIKVEEHEVINPSGNPGIYGKVFFKKVAVGVIPLDENGNTWLVGQYRYTLEEYSWEIPMGGGDFHDELIESAKRELKEETGLNAERWDEILKIHTSNSVTDEVGYIYVARGLSQGETEFDDTEDLVIKKVKFSEAVRMVMDGEITDSLSLAGILKLQRLIENKQI